MHAYIQPQLFFEGSSKKEKLKLNWMDAVGDDPERADRPLQAVHGEAEAGQGRGGGAPHHRRRPLHLQHRRQRLPAELPGVPRQGLQLHPAGVRGVPRQRRGGGHTGRARARRARGHLRRPAAAGVPAAGEGRQPPQARGLQRRVQHGGRELQPQARGAAGQARPGAAGGAGGVRRPVRPPVGHDCQAMGIWV